RAGIPPSGPAVMELAATASGEAAGTQGQVAVSRRPFACAVDRHPRPRIVACHLDPPVVPKPGRSDRCLRSKLPAVFLRVNRDSATSRRISGVRGTLVRVTSPDPTATFGLVVRFTVRPGSETAFDELTAETVAEVRRHEPGTVLYLCHEVDGAPQERIFYELYR